jgi:hypothetical protein
VPGRLLEKFKPESIVLDDSTPLLSVNERDVSWSDRRECVSGRFRSRGEDD